MSGYEGYPKYRSRRDGRQSASRGIKYGEEGLMECLRRSGVVGIEEWCSKIKSKYCLGKRKMEVGPKSRGYDVDDGDKPY
jgi:hypothetical protein